MKILVYGAGNIGRLYAGKLAASGCDVSILVRGDRWSEIQQHGIELEDGVTGQRSAVVVEAVDQLAPNDAYDLVLVVVPHHKVSQVLPVLAKNLRTPNVMFFGNNVTGADELVNALGPTRVLLGFPGAGAVSTGRVVRYVVTSKREQPTTIGELDGSTTARITRIASALEAAGFPTAICADMDAWLKTHVAEILPTVAALYRAAGDPDRLAGSDAELRLMLRSIREGYAVLRSNGVAITPAMHRMFDVLPEPALLAAMRARLRAEAAELKLGHALHARDEWTKLAADFDATFDSKHTLTPCSDVLFRQLAPSPPVPFISADVQRYIEEQLLLGGVVGCAIGVTSPAVPARVFSFGMADLDGKHRVETDTRFHLFSGTKLYTAAAVMLLVEREQLDLDAPVLDYLPDLPVSQTLTARHLASHTSGLSDSMNGFLAVHLPGEDPPSATDALEAYRLGRSKPPGGGGRVPQCELRHPRSAGGTRDGTKVRRLRRVQPARSLGRQPAVRNWARRCRSAGSRARASGVGDGCGTAPRLPRGRAPHLRPTHRRAHSSAPLWSRQRSEWRPRRKCSAVPSPCARDAFGAGWSAAGAVQEADADPTQPRRRRRRLERRRRTRMEARNNRSHPVLESRGRRRRVLQ